ncbi:MAG: thiol:disulfide interchange protein DsbA/DsbL [Rehaibacterium terrae]|uniref:thiol:disulfide interchange protein DsbA/DsbL n=1 Tax=Rehaibacterium terrae TaxID=1341696 RepID=UPI00391BB942
MLRSLALALSLALLAACGGQSPDTAGTPAAAPAADTGDTAAPSADASAAEDTAAAVAPPPGPAPVEGVDYTRIEPAMPAQPVAGKVEVAEVFGYTCIHCANLQPHVNAWKKRLPAHVNFIYVPAAFGGFWTPYARAFYTAEAMGVLDATHDALFHAIHVERSLPMTADAAPRIAQWYGRHGVDPAVFASTMDSFAVNAKIARSQQLLQRWGIEATPTFVVAGKYKVMATREGGLEGMLRTVDWLVAREHAAQAR